MKCAKNGCIALGSTKAVNGFNNDKCPVHARDCRYEAKFDPELQRRYDEETAQADALSARHA